MVRSGGREDGIFAVWHEANVTSMAFEHVLILERKLPSLARVGVGRVVGNTKSNFAFGKVGEIILDWLIDELRSF